MNFPFGNREQIGTVYKHRIIKKHTRSFRQPFNDGFIKMAFFKNGLFKNGLGLLNMAFFKTTFKIVFSSFLKMAFQKRAVPIFSPLCINYKL